VKQNGIKSVFQALKTLLVVLEERMVCFLVVKTSDVFITKEGEVHAKTFTQPSPDRR
jgi:hypothetical protein